LSTNQRLAVIWKALILLLLSVAASKPGNGQQYLLSNEKVIFSFNAGNNKKMVLARDSADKYIIYRFGTADKIEFEFPEKTKDSRSKFTYSFYLRGGEKQNEAMDLNYVYFISGSFKYVIYQTYTAQDEKLNCGIKVINISTNKMVDIKGNANTVIGNLTDFRDNGMLKIGDETFE
jgi:hypothetical protein